MFVLVSQFVVCAVIGISSCSKEADQTTTTPAIPPGQAPEVDVLYSFVGEVLEVIQGVPVSGDSTIVVYSGDVDIRWTVKLRVLTVLKGSPPSGTEKEVYYVVHSPTRTFSPIFKGIEGKKFRVDCVEDRSTDKALIHRWRARELE